MIKVLDLQRPDAPWNFNSLLPILWLHISQSKDSAIVLYSILALFDKIQALCIDDLAWINKACARMQTC